MQVDDPMLLKGGRVVYTFLRTANIFADGLCSVLSLIWTKKEQKVRDGWAEVLREMGLSLKSSYYKTTFHILRV